MADMIKFYKGLEASLPASGVNGALYVTTDEGAIYLGTGTGMKRLGDFVQVANVEALPAKAHENCLYYCVAENILAKWNGTEWKQVNKQPTTEELKTLLGLGTLAYKSEVAEADLNANLANKINNKVDKIEGKGLSTNDLTDELKGQYDTAYTHSQAEHAPVGAQANVIETVKVNGTALTVTDKAVDITVPTGALAGKDKVAKADLDEALATEIDNKVAKETGKSLVADTEIAKLAGVSEGANKVEASETNGNIKIDGVDTTVYIHPESHTASEISDFAVEVAKVKVENAGHADTAGNANKVANALTVKVGGADVVFDGSEAKTADVDAAIEAAINAIPEQTDYTVTCADTDYEATTDAPAFKRHTLTQNGNTICTIDIPKELVVEAGSVKEVTVADAPYAGAKVGDKYIELVIANQDAPIYVPAKDLVDIYTAKELTAESTDEVKVAISNTNEISATLVDGKIAKSKLAADVQASLGKADTALQEHQDISHLASQQSVDKIAIDVENITKTDGTIDTKVKAAIDAEVLRADGKYEEKGVAAGLDAALKSELQGEIGNKLDANGWATSAESDEGTLLYGSDNRQVIISPETMTLGSGDNALVYERGGIAVYGEKGEAVLAHDGLYYNRDHYEFPTQEGTLAVIEDVNAAKTELQTAIDGKADAQAVEELANDLEDAKTATSNQDAAVLAEAQAYADQAEADAIAAAKTETENQVKALADTLYTQDEVDALLTWGEF